MFLQIIILIPHKTTWGKMPFLINPICHKIMATLYVFRHFIKRLLRSIFVYIRFYRLNILNQLVYTCNSFGD